MDNSKQALFNPEVCYSSNIPTSRGSTSMSIHIDAPYPRTRFLIQCLCAKCIWHHSSGHLKTNSHNNTLNDNSAVKDNKAKFQRASLPASTSNTTSVLCTGRQRSLPSHDRARSAWHMTFNLNHAIVVCSSQADNLLRRARLAWRGIDNGSR